MNKLEKAKEIIKKVYRYADCGIFNTRNLCGDDMENIYSDKELTIDICFTWLYLEVFGLSDEEFKELVKYYEKLCGRW